MRNKFFLYQLYKHSKIAFILVAVFVTVYAILFYKKMDMLFFRYNNMFSQIYDTGNTVTTFAIKADGVPVKITTHLYWKKDFLESSLATYAHYIQQNRKTFLHAYLDKNYKSSHWYPGLINALITDSASAAQFPLWYYQFATQTQPLKNDTIKVEVWQYNYQIEKSSFGIRDSILLQQNYYSSNALKYEGNQ